MNIQISNKGTKIGIDGTEVYSGAEVAEKIFQRKEWRDVFLALSPVRDESRVRRIIRLWAEVYAGNKSLAACTRDSLLGTLVSCVETDLEPGDQNGYCYIIPRAKGDRNVATFTIGYRGLVKLARNSGLMGEPYAHVIYENDEYDVQLGDSPRVYHKPKLSGDRGKMIAAYCVAPLKDGTKIIHIMTREDIARIHRLAPQNSQAWKIAPDRMWIAKCMRQAAKQWPTSPALETAVNRDALCEIGGVVTMDDMGVIRHEQPAPQEIKQQRDIPSEFVIDTSSAAQQQKAIIADPFDIDEAIAEPEDSQKSRQQKQRQQHAQNKQQATKQNGGSSRDIGDDIPPPLPEDYNMF